MQSIDLIETYAYETNGDLASEKEEIKFNNTLKRPNWPQITDHPYRMIITGGSVYVKQIHYLI